MHDLNPDSLKRLLPFFLLLALIPALPALAQSTAADSLVRLAEEHHRHYRFDDALDCYDEALDSLAARPDSLRSAADTLAMHAIEARMLLSRNGLAMTEFVDQPEVIARRRFLREDFFRYYPFPDSSWVIKPNRADRSAATPLSPVTLVNGADVYFSAPDSTGIYRLWHSTHRSDGRYTPAEPFDASVPEGANCIFPVLSPDGERLYFASDGLYGVGGYDLYSIRWNSRRRGWDAPVNLGFPYNSPADDFLFAQDPNRSQALFATNRSCPADSVDVCVVSFNAVPVYTPMTDPEDLEALARLELPVEETVDDDPFAGRDHAELYMKRMAQVRSLRDSLSTGIKAADRLRSEYSAAPDSLRAPLQERILAAEQRQEQLREEIARLTQEVRAIEAIFLEDGLVLNPDKVAAPKEVREPYTWVCSALSEDLLFTRRERQIITLSDPVMYVTTLPQDSLILRRKSIDFTEDELASPLLDTLIRKMLSTVTAPSQEGVGIAAPQVGINRRLVLVQRLDKEGEPFEAYANIRIDTLTGPIVHGAEGCLSVPGMRGMVARHSEVTISYVNPTTLESCTETVKGFTAVIFQHETDHLEGILYIDRTQIVAEDDDWAEKREQYDYSRPQWW